MELEVLKKYILQVNFSQEIKEELLEIINLAITRGELLEEEKEKILKLIQLDVDLQNVDSNALEKISESISDFDKDLGEIVTKEDSYNQQANQ